MNTLPAPASSWEAVAAALFAKDLGGNESEGARSATPESEASDAENVDAFSGATTTTMATRGGGGPTSSVLSYAAFNGRQALGGGSKRKRAVLKGGEASSMMAASMATLSQQQQQQPTTPSRSNSSASTSTAAAATGSTPPPHSHTSSTPTATSSSSPPPSSNAAALAHLRSAMLSWSAALTRLQPKCVVDDAARERGLRLLVRFQGAVRCGGGGYFAGGGGGGGGGAPSPSSSSSSSSPPSSSSSSSRVPPPPPPYNHPHPHPHPQNHHYRADFCSTPLPPPSPLTHAQVASALWIAIKAEGVRCAVPSRGLLARATGVAPGELAAAELAMLVALKFDVFLGDVLFFRGGEEMEAEGAGGKENAMV